MRRVFDAMDRNRDGKVDFKELTEVLVVLWIGYFISLVAVVEMMPRTSALNGANGPKPASMMASSRCRSPSRAAI